MASVLPARLSVRPPLAHPDGVLRGGSTGAGGSLHRPRKATAALRALRPLAWPRTVPAQPRVALAKPGAAQIAADRPHPAAGTRRSAQPGAGTALNASVGCVRPPHGEGALVALGTSASSTDTARGPVGHPRSPPPCRYRSRAVRHTERRKHKELRGGCGNPPSTAPKALSGVRLCPWLLVPGSLSLVPCPWLLVPGSLSHC